MIWLFVFVFLVVVQGAVVVFGALVIARNQDLAMEETLAEVRRGRSLKGIADRR